MTHAIRASIEVHAPLAQALRSWSELAGLPFAESDVTFAPLAIGRVRITVQVAADAVQARDAAGERALEHGLRAFKRYAEKSARERRAGEPVRGGWSARGARTVAPRSTLGIRRRA
jgi:hypothetical protein